MDLYGNLFGKGQTYGGLLTEQDKEEARRKTMMAIATQLLQAGGPSRLPVSTGQAIGGALQAGGMAQDESYQGALQAALLRQKMQPQPKDRGRLVMVAGPDGKPVYKYEDEAAGQTPYMEPTEARGNKGVYSPGDYTTKSWAAFEQSGDPAVLERYTTPRQEYAPSYQRFTRTLPDGSTQDYRFNSRTGEDEPIGPVVAAGTKSRTDAQARAQGEAEGSQAAKAPVEASMDYVIGRFKDVIDKTPQGGPMGSKAVTGIFTDFQATREFENQREQLSTELRTAFRIPGEGTLSDREQAQYGIQLPDRKNLPELNKRILDDIKKRVSLRLGTAVGGPRADATGPVQVIDFGDLPDGR